MARRQTIKTFDLTFRDIMDVDESFDGKVIIFWGDFRQVLLVFVKSTRAKIVNVNLEKSYLWPKIEKIQLTRNMRARTDPALVISFVLKTEKIIE